MTGLESTALMNERVWTRDELDDVWPLPDGWVWAWDGWTWRAESSGFVAAWVDGNIDCHGGVPIEVVLAVASVALGFDSREKIAGALEKSGDLEERIGKAAGGTSIVTGMARCAEAYRCAAVVRRGTVLP